MVPETFSFVIAGFCQGETGRPSARTEDSRRTGLGPGSALAEKIKKISLRKQPLLPAPRRWERF